ncbi:MAG: Gfo/Idh/MocA family oxidoreductase [Bauldia sp.]
MNETIARLGRRLRLGVIGGGPGSFVGPVHRIAARIDDNYELVASVLSSDPERARANGRALGIAADRAYGSAEAMFAGESQRPDGMEVVAIMTPNDSHHALAVAALEHGLDVICDKPLTTNMGDALDLVTRVHDTGLVFCTTFNYSGFPLVRQARAMIRDGDLGEIRMVHVQYIQGYNYVLSGDEERGNADNWRLRPERVGPSTVLGDIGSHAWHLASFVTGMQFDRLMADVTAVVPGRKSDDYAGILFRLENGAAGNMWITQAGAGAVHGLCFRVFGTKGGLEWFEEEPNRLTQQRPGQPALLFERGGPGLKPEAERAQRTYMGHPEGFHEAFAVLYADVAKAVVARRLKQPLSTADRDFPTVEDGARAVRFMEASLESSRTKSWVDCRLKM